MQLPQNSKKKWTETHLLKITGCILVGLLRSKAGETEDMDGHTDQSQSTPLLTMHHRAPCPIQDSNGAWQSCCHLYAAGTGTSLNSFDAHGSHEHFNWLRFRQKWMFPKWQSASDKMQAMEHPRRSSRQGTEASHYFAHAGNAFDDSQGKMAPLNKRPQHLLCKLLSAQGQLRTTCFSQAHCHNQLNGAEQDCCHLHETSHSYEVTTFSLSSFPSNSYTPWKKRGHKITIILQILKSNFSIWASNNAAFFPPMSFFENSFCSTNDICALQSAFSKLHLFFLSFKHWKLCCLWTSTSNTDVRTTNNFLAFCPLVSRGNYLRSAHLEQNLSPAAELFPPWNLLTF